MSRLKVLFTVDTEIWPGAWDDVDARFPEAFRRYVYGDTPHGQYALPMTLKILRDHGLRGVFFVEPLFSARFGIDPLREIVGLIQEGGQDVQMHLHPEWADEALEPVLPTPAKGKELRLSRYSLDEQTSMIRWGRDRLVEAGAPLPSVFRAGSFRCNSDTLRALKRNAIGTDSSYNHCYNGPASGLYGDLPKGEIPLVPSQIEGVTEVPVTVYRDRPRHLRPLQLTACSLTEIVTVLERAAACGYPCVNIVSHNFELLDRRDFSVDRIVLSRFLGLCRYLRDHSARFESATFHDLRGAADATRLPPVRGSATGLARRWAEQVIRRF